MLVKRGDIFYVDFGETVGSEQGGVRPALVIQNDVGNRYSSTVIVAAMTSQTNKAKLPTHVFLEEGRGGLNKNSTIMMEQVRTIDKKRLKEKIGHLDYVDMLNINMAMVISFGLSIFTGIFNLNSDKTYSVNYNHAHSIV